MLPVSAMLNSAGLEILSIKEEMLLLGYRKKFSLNYKLWLPLREFSFLMPNDKHARRGATVLAGVTDTDQWRRLDGYYTFGAKRKNTCGMQEIHLGDPCYSPTHSSYGQIRKFCLRRAWSQGTYPSETRVWVTRQVNHLDKQKWYLCMTGV